MPRHRLAPPAVLVVAGLVVAAAVAPACSLRQDRGAEAAVPPAAPAPVAPVASLMGAGAAATAGASGLVIPQAHPRLWWTPERLKRGRVWIKDNAPRLRDDAPASSRALRYLLAGDRDEGRKAVEWLLGFTPRIDGVASDEARWAGEDAMLVFDWCHDLLSSDQRRMLVDRWNGVTDTLNRKEWGGPGLEGNNYYWGYLRNGLEWGIASFHENPRAAELIDHAVNERYRKGFVPFANGPGRGAVLGEGTQYGPYILRYATIPFVTAAQQGVDLWNASGFFKEAVFYLLHATTPAPTVGAAGGEPHFEIFPFNDDEKWRYGGSGELPELGMFMLAAAEQWAASPVGAYARGWLAQVKPRVPDIGLAAAAPAGASRAPTDLPLDYFADGAGFLYARNKWGRDATVLQAQLGRPQHVGHEHADWGTFQLWRAGRWLTRESVGYGEPIANWGGGPAPGGDKASSSGPIAHNGVLFEGMGPRTVGHRKGNPRLVRLESRPSYVYAAVDLGDSYRCDSECRKERDENEFAGGAVRELLFVRPLEALVVLDRVVASGERKPAREVTKTFVLHTEPRPTVEGNRLLAVSGDQALRVWTLLPAKATPRVVVEGPPVGQHRIEIDTRGSELSYFLHVLQGRGAKDPDLGVWLYENEAGVTVTLSHPTRGIAKVMFEKGAGSKGGKFGYAGAGEPPLAPLAEGIATMTVTDRGPVWR